MTWTRGCIRADSLNLASVVVMAGALCSICCCQPAACCCAPPARNPTQTPTPAYSAALCSIVNGEDVRTVMCLQEDSDMAYFDLDIAPILERCAARSDVRHVRHRIR